MTNGSAGSASAPKRADRSALSRHIAIFAAAIAAVVIRHEWRTQVILLLGLGAIANVAVPDVSRAAGRPHIARISPLLGVAFWAALVFFTGGVKSPLVGGFWLEIIFSALFLPPVATLAVSAAVVVSLWSTQAVIGLAGEVGTLCLESGLVLASGLVGFYASRRWRTEHRTLSDEAQAVSRRLLALERELETARTLGHVGQQVARLAHRLKNAVHSLRGFAKLIERSRVGVDAPRSALQGLARAIDRLDETAQAMLKPPDPEAGDSRVSTGAQLARALNDVVSEVSRDHGGLQWILPAHAPLPSIALPPSDLHELLLIVTRNAAEASGDAGSVLLKADLDTDANALRLTVEDHGPGFAICSREAPLRPGMTTKQSGSGFGLFLARCLLESSGGELSVGDTPHGGASVSMRLPLVPGL